MHTIVTHPGTPMRNEIFAMCILMAENMFERIERRAVTRADLEDSEIVVLGTGEKLEPQRNNFDHSCLPYDAMPRCVLTLVLQHMKIYDLACMASPWIAYVELMDTKGLLTAQQSLGISTKGFSQIISPFENFLIQEFRRNFEITKKHAIFELMDKMGSSIMDHWDKFGNRLDILRGGEAAVVGYLGDVGDVMIVPNIHGTANPLLALEAYCRERSAAQGRPIVATITRSNTGIGWNLYRRDDAIDLDFSRLQRIPGVCYTHPGGFVAQTHEMEAAQALNLVRLAMKQAEPADEDQTSTEDEEDTAHAAERANP